MDLKGRVVCVDGIKNVDKQITHKLTMSSRQVFLQSATTQMESSINFF